MKKFLMLVVVLFVAVALIGCAEEDKDPTAEEVMALITVVDAFDDVAMDAIDAAGSVTGPISYTIPTASVAGTYTNDGGDEVYNLDVALAAYVYNDGSDDYTITGSMTMEYSDIEEFSTVIGSGSYPGYTVSVNMTISSAAGLTGTYTVNGVTFPVSTILNYVKSKPSSKSISRFLKK